MTERGPDTSRKAETQELQVAWNGKSLTARGVGVYMAVAVLAIILSIFYSGYLTTQAISAGYTRSVADHEKIKGGLDRASCMVNLTFEERARFRESYAPGAFKRWCPWVDE